MVRLYGRDGRTRVIRRGRSHSDAPINLAIESRKVLFPHTDVPVPSEVRVIAAPNGTHPLTLTLSRRGRGNGQTAIGPLLAIHKHFLKEGGHTMKTFVALASVVFLAATALAEPQRVTLEGGTTEARWSLKELNPELPSDWSEFEFVTIELKSTTAQRFELRLFTPLGVRKVRMQPFQGAWIRAALPLAFFEKRSQEGHDLASLGNKSRAAYWVGLTGSIGPLTHVEAIGVGMENPIGADDRNPFGASRQAIARRCGARAQAVGR